MTDEPSVPVFVLEGSLQELLWPEESDWSDETFMDGLRSACHAAHVVTKKCRDSNVPPHHALRCVLAILTALADGPDAFTPASEHHPLQ